MDRILETDAGRTRSRRIGRKTIAGVGLTAMVFAGVAGSALAATLVGDARPNDIVGTAGPDVIRGLGGADDLYGGDGDDRIRGGRGHDDIEGGPGNDRLFGGPGEDDLYGGPGNDRIRAVDRHHDDIECGDGFDRVWANPGDDVAADCERVVRRGVPVSPRSGAGPAPSAAATVGIDGNRAGEIAAAHVGGRVDEIEPERDYGAAWEVEVYAPNGEYVIYVSATGEIVRVVGPSRW